MTDKEIDRLAEKLARELRRRIAIAEQAERKRFARRFRRAKEGGVSASPTNPAELVPCVCLSLSRKTMDRIDAHFGHYPLCHGRGACTPAEAARLPEATKAE